MTATTVHVDTDTGEILAEGDHAALFNGAAYTKPLPTLDGHRPDTLKVAFAGSVEIDAMIDGDVAWFQGLRFGQELQLTVTAVVGKHGWTIKRNADSGDETVVHTLGLAVHSIDLADE